VSGSNPSLITRTEYFPGFKSGAANLPDSSETRRIGCVRFSPVISIRAPATIALDGSLTVPEIVSARKSAENAAQNKIKAKNRNNLESLHISLRLCSDLQLLQGKEDCWDRFMGPRLDYLECFSSLLLTPLTSPYTLRTNPSSRNFSSQAAFPLEQLFTRNLRRANTERLASIRRRNF